MQELHSLSLRRYTHRLPTKRLIHITHKNGDMLYATTRIVAATDHKKILIKIKNTTTQVLQQVGHFNNEHFSGTFARVETNSQYILVSISSAKLKNKSKW